MARRAILWLHVLDNLLAIPDISHSDIIKAFDEDCAKPLYMVLDRVREVLGQDAEIESVVHYCTYFTGSEFVIEYVLRMGPEVISMKLLYTDDPCRLLQGYYRVEKVVCRPGKELHE